MKFSTLRFCPSISGQASLLVFPGGSDGKESACNSGGLSSIPGLGRFPWRREWQPTPVFLPEESHGQRSLAGRHATVHRATESRAWLKRLSKQACARSLVEACRMLICSIWGLVPSPGMEPGLHWKCRVLATGPGKSLDTFNNYSMLSSISFIVLFLNVYCWCILVYNVVFISAIQRNDSVIYI